MAKRFDFTTADWHLGEDRFEIMGRPFTSQQQHIDVLVENYNRIVPPNAQVLMLGDAVYQKAPEFLSQVARFNGIKTLVRGNHDRVFTDADLAPYFVDIVPEGEGTEVEMDGVTCWATHYPTRARPDMFNLVGHIHAAWKYQLNSLNVGIDVNHFLPVAAAKIPFSIKAIESFYDDDVWVAYNDANARYRDTRGKKGSYFG